MAQVGQVTDVLVVPADRADQTRENHIPVLKWVLGAMVGVVLSTLGGFIWVLQEILAAHPVLGSPTLPEALGGATDLHVVRTILFPMLVTAIGCGLLAFIGVRSVKVWGTRILAASKQEQARLQTLIDDAESRLSLSQAAIEFWKGQARAAAEQRRTAEVARHDLEGRMDQLAVREKQLAREQEELSRSKDRLEKHVELRTIELHRLKRRFESILNCAGEGICGFDLEGRITFANPAAASMMGWAGEDLLGKNDADVFADHGGRNRPEGEDRGVDHPSHPAPVIFLRKDSTRFPVEMIRTPVEETGRKVGEVLVFKDVTERTEADERFAAKVSELARSNSELEQFAFVASHDLQEPLRKIQAFGDRLRTRLGEDIAAEALDYLKRMQSAAARMQGLIDGLLMYSRVLTRAQPFTKVDLNVVVHEVMEDLEVRVEKSQANVEVQELPSLEADALQIRQLLQNLIGNALKFQSHGNQPHVRITARILPQGHSSHSDAGGTDFVTKVEMCELTVEDNGIGFDESYLNRLFVVFQRLHSRTEFEGTGIGLAVCRKIVNRHGGSITARSTPGVGSKFIVLLPKKQRVEKGGAG